MSETEGPRVWERGDWYIVREKNASGSDLFRPINAKTGATDWPVMYSDGRIAYDRPESLPTAVYVAVGALHRAARIDAAETEQDALRVSGELGYSMSVRIEYICTKRGPHACDGFFRSTPPEFSKHVTPGNVARKFCTVWREARAAMINENAPTDAAPAA